MRARLGTAAQVYLFLSLARRARDLLFLASLPLSLSLSLSRQWNACICDMSSPVNTARWYGFGLRVWVAFYILDFGVPGRRPLTF